MNNNPFDGLVSFDTPEKHMAKLEEVISNASPASSNQIREFGRWNMRECQIYLEVLKNGNRHELIKELKKAIPSRA